MSRFFHITMLMALLVVTFGCAQNYYNVPRESYEKKVRVLGVAPIFLDGDSDIRLPERDALLAVIREANRKNEAELVARLKDTGAYLTVRMPDVQADQLFSSLFFRRERRSDGGVLYNKHFYKQPELKEFINKNSLDAVMLVTVSGLTRPEKVFSSNYLSYLETDYNFLIMTAQILDADGNILWEYPNFQRRPFALHPLLNLQYADFDEAEANATDKVDVKVKTIPGVTRSFEKSAKSLLRQDAKVSTLYRAVFDDMVSLLEPEFKFPWDKGREDTKVEQSRPEPMATRSVPPEAKPGLDKVESPKAEPAAIPADPPPLAPGEIKTETLK
jgi:hypothetical protein